MSSSAATASAAMFLLFLATTTASGAQPLQVVQMARAAVVEAGNWARGESYIARPHELDQGLTSRYARQALSDCATLYGESEFRLGKLMAGGANHTLDDARAWLSGVWANHGTCLDGLAEKGLVGLHKVARNLSMLLNEALDLYAKRRRTIKKGKYTWLSWCQL